MNKKELKELSAKELDEKIAEASQAYNKEKINHVVSPLENPMKLRYKRRLIAKLKTELRQRELNK